MAENTLDFQINGNKNMDILSGVHGSFINQKDSLLTGGIIHTVVSDYGDMLFQGIPAHFGSIWLSKYHIVHKAKLSAQANASSLEAMHMIAGNVSYTPDGLAHSVSMKAGDWQMMYLPHVRNEVTFPAGTNITTLDFHYNESWLHALSPFFKDLDVFLGKVAKENAALLCRQPVPFPDKVSNHLGEFFSMRKSERDQNLFIERHMSDWLASSLESPFLSGIVPLYIHKNEHTRMLEVHECMMQRLSEPMTTASLAKMAQINEFKFKRFFKSMFKMPVHRLLTDERLKKAKDLLPDNSISITSIANICGYETAAAFSKSFKKKYGLPPSAFRSSKTIEEIE
jgi:AraC-like DNA-binding protein